MSYPWLSRYALVGGILIYAGIFAIGAIVDSYKHGERLYGIGLFSGLAIPFLALNALVAQALEMRRRGRGAVNG